MKRALSSAALATLLAVAALPVAAHAKTTTAANAGAGISWCAVCGAGAALSAFALQPEGVVAFAVAGTMACAY